MSNAELIERLRNFDSVFDSDKILDEAADALEAADKRIAEQAEEITMLRYRHLITCGTTHPEMYKTELDHAKERIAELEKEAQFNFEQYQDAGRLLCEANEKLAVAREALIQLANAADNQGAFTGMSWQQAKAITTAALAQIAATEQK